MTAVSASATGSVAGTFTAEAQAATGGAAQAAAANLQAFALVEGLPISASTTAVKGANVQIAAAFATSSQIFAVAQFGGAGSTAAAGPQTITDDVKLTLQLSQSEDLLIGIYNGAALGNGVSNLALTISVNGTAAFTQTFASLASLSAFFTNDAFALHGLAQNNAVLDIAVSMTVNAPGDGYGFGLLIGGASQGGAPAIAGAVTGQAITDAQTVNPLAQVTITDLYRGTVSVTLSNAANGILSNLGSGTYNAATGIYTLTGTGTELTAALDALIFTPTVRLKTFATSVTTGFVIALNDGINPPVTDLTTSVVAADLQAPLPSLVINSAALQSNQTTLALAGVINAANAGLAIYIYDGVTLLGAAAGDALGMWATTVTVATPGVHGLTAYATNALGTGLSNYIVDLVAASTALVGGGQFVLFSGSGDAVSLASTVGLVDSVFGWNGTVYLTSAQAMVGGGKDLIYFQNDSGNLVTLSNSLGTWDTVIGSNGAISLNGALASVYGGGNTVSFIGGNDNAVAILNTGPAPDTVTGSNAVVEMVNALAIINGGSDLVYFMGTETAVLYNTGGTWDSVIGSNGVVDLDNALAAIYGGGNIVAFTGGSGNVASLVNTNFTWDSVTVANGVIELNGALALINGTGNTIYFTGGPGNAASITNTGASSDNVIGANGVIELNGAMALVSGGADTVYFLGGAGNFATLFNTGGTWDNVIGANGVVELNSAMAAIYGGGDTVYFSSGTGNVAALNNTAGNWDNVVGSNGIVELSGALASIYGSSDTMTFLGGVNTAAVNAPFEAFVFTPASFGTDTIVGFSSSDTMQFSVGDFASWTAVQSHMTQSGSDTVITLDPFDKVILGSTLMSSVQASQFKFM